MKKNQKKLSLNKVQISELNVAEQQALNGGFLSIGHECSVRNTCGRLIRSMDDDLQRCLDIHMPATEEAVEN